MILSILSFLISPFLRYNNFIIYSTIISFIFLYKNKLKNLNIIFIILLGISDDILFSYTYKNIIIYPVIYLLIDYYFSFKKYNLKNILLILLFIIFIYNFIDYILLNIFTNYKIDYIYFITNLIYIYLINIIYTIVIYLFIKIKK